MRRLPKELPLLVLLLLPLLLLLVGDEADAHYSEHSQEPGRK